MFYTVNQNNSGGGYIQDEYVDQLVCVEADSATEAESILENLVDDHGYNDDSCPCCGDNFYISLDETDGTDFISDGYGSDVEITELGVSDKRYRRYAIVHYKGGTRKKYDRVEKIWEVL